MSGQSKSRSLRDLSGSKVATQDLEAVIEEIKNTSDRTTAIILASWVERELEESLFTILPRHDDDTKSKLLARDGALGSFYGKIYLAFALGLYDETTRDNLDCIRKIRNAFAHAAISITFETSQVATEVNKLRTRAIETPIVDLPGVSSSRRKYMLVCAMFVVTARLRAMGARFDLIAELMETVGPFLGEGKGMSDLAQRLREAAQAAKEVSPE
jgi:hypothetical protein